MDLSDWLAARARTTPQATAVTIGPQQWSYDELDRRVNGICHHLAPIVQSGQKVSVLLPNNLTYVCLIHAIARLGAVLVPLNIRLTTPELLWQLTLTDSQLVIYGDDTAITAQTLQSNGRILLNSSNWTIKQTSSRPENVPFDLSNIQAIIFTSGTTGQPKGAMLTFANHFYSATASAFRLGLHATDMWLSCLPLYHVGGLAVIFRSCLYGTAVDLHSRFDLEAINHALDNKSISMISLVPTMLQRLLATRSHWPATLRLILLGGAAATPELVQQANALARHSNTQEGNGRMRPKPLIATTYGLTEAASQVTTMLPDKVQYKPGSVGKPLLFSQIQIVADDGRSLPTGEIGEVAVSGPTVMVGYFGNTEATAVAIRHGHLFTGDIGYLDDDGDLWLVQRRSDIIVSGGENIYPAEVEKVLRQHPDIVAVAVVGIPHTEWGQQVAAMIVKRPGVDLAVDAIIGYGRRQLASYKLPRLIRFTDHLPLTASGKIERRKVAQQLKE